MESSFIGVEFEEVLMMCLDFCEIALFQLRDALTQYLFSFLQCRQQPNQLISACIEFFLHLSVALLTFSAALSYSSTVILSKFLYSSPYLASNCPLLSFCSYYMSGSLYSSVAFCSADLVITSPAAVAALSHPLTLPPKSSVSALYSQYADYTHLHYSSYPSWPSTCAPHCQLGVPNSTPIGGSTEWSCRIQYPSMMRRMPPHDMHSYPITLLVLVT